MSLGNSENFTLDSGRIPFILLILHLCQVQASKQVSSNMQKYTYHSVAR